MDDRRSLVDDVSDAVLPAAGPPVTVERLAQRRPDATRVLCERSVEELDAGYRDGLGQSFGELTSGGAGDLYAVGHSGDVRLRCASSARTSLSVKMR